MTMSANATEPRSVYAMTRGEAAVIGGLLVAACVGVFFTVRTPIPSGDATREGVAKFLKQLYRDREVSPSDRPAAPVAVVFHLIRSGEPAVARRAIAFAAEKQFGSAAPYVIGRLGSDDPELERAAQHFLRTIAGGDYGPDAASWRAWWRDPPKNVLGLSVGWTTLKIAVTGGIALSGLSLMLWRSRRTVAGLGGGFLGIAYFLTFCDLLMRFVGTPYTCTFGGISITYYIKPIGLEDARIGGAGLVFLAMAGFVLVPFVLVLVYHVLVKEASLRADRAGVGQVALPADGERGP
jgi:hypothetical protein